MMNPADGQRRQLKYHQAATACARILKSSSDRLHQPAPIRIRSLRGVSFDRVDFAYRFAGPVLKQVSFTMKRGESWLWSVRAARGQDSVKICCRGLMHWWRIFIDAVIFASWRCGFAKLVALVARMFFFQRYDLQNPLWTPPMRRKPRSTSQRGRRMPRIINAYRRL